jgi:diguanylate cyclase (GGDEF)-like protein/PAS domain S-box-containing protein
MSALPKPHGRHILLVEDDPYDIEIIRRCFETSGDLGVEIVHAGTLAAGLRFAASGEANLILLDLDLPDSRGLETLERMGAVAQCPVVVISGHRHPALVEEALKRRAYEVLQKDSLDERTLRRVARLAFGQHAAEASLRDSEAQLRATFEHAAIGLAHVDAEGRIRMANQKLCDILGYRREELIGKTVREISHPEDVDIAKLPRARLIAGEIPQFSVRKRYLNARGESVWLKVTAALLSGTPGYEISALEDISETVRAEQQLAQSEQRFRSLVELSPDAILVHDFSTVRFVNPACVQLLGASSPEQLLGRTMWDIVDPRDHEMLRGRFQGLAAGDRLPFIELRWVRVDGVPVEIEVAAAPIEFNGRPAAHVVARDVTQRKLEEQQSAAAEQRRRLEHRVTRRLAEAENAGAGIRGVLRALCQSESWACGRYFALDEASGRLRLAEAWGVDEPVLQAFLRESRSISFAPGEGLTGRAWQSGATVWSQDVTSDARIAHPLLGQRTGLRSALAIPVLVQSQVLGVLTISSLDIREPDPRQLRTLAAIGNQMGQFLTRKRAERAIALSEERFRTVVAALNDGIVVYDRDLRIVSCNAAAERILGVAEADLVGREGFSSVVNIFEGGGLVLESGERPSARTLRTGEGIVGLEAGIRRPDGSERWISVNTSALAGPDGVPVGVVSSLTDITERRAAEQALRESEGKMRTHAERQASVARFGQFALGETKLDRLLDEALAAMQTGGGDTAALLELETEEGRYLVRAARGHGTEGAVGRSAALSPEAKWPQALRERGWFIADEAYLKTRPEGRPWSAWVRAMASGLYVAVHGERGLFGVLCVFARQANAFAPEDMRFFEAIGASLSTAIRRLQAEERLAHLAQFDGLSGLPNRALLADRLDQAIAQARRREGHVGVLFVDLDRMKLVNDSLGHHLGDTLIRQVAQRLQGCVRAGDTVGRISGDEFAVVLAELGQPDDAAIVALKILENLAAAFDLDGNETFVTASIGIAAFAQDGEDASTLLRNADMAMYRAKESGRNGYCFFTADMNARTLARMQLNTDLRRALERGEFELYYQPKVDLGSGALRGLEALLRWKHPERGMVSPAEFIPVLEDSGLIVPVGEWVVGEACAQVARWQAQGSRPVPVAVNLSAKQFRRGDLESGIRQALARSGVSPELLELEITESYLMENPDEAIRTLHALRAAGLKIFVDDFGTGYSSLAYLARFPLSALKIDRAFVKSVDSDPTSAAIVRAVINMAQNLRMEVVAEGVETEQQANHLRLYGCHQAQGFLFSRPVPAAEITPRLAAPAR